MTRHPQKRLQLWSQRGSCCLVDCSMSHYAVNIYVSTLTFCRRVKTCAWQPCGPGVKLLEELCLYLSVSNKAIFAQQVFFLRCHVTSFSEGVVRDHCRVIRPLQQTLSASDKTAPTQPWKLHSVSLALIPSPSLRKLPTRKGFAFHIYHCHHDKAMQRYSRKYQREKRKINSCWFVTFYGKI